MATRWYGWEPSMWFALVGVQVLFAIVGWLFRRSPPRSPGQLSPWVYFLGGAIYLIAAVAVLSDFGIWQPQVTGGAAFIIFGYAAGGGYNLHRGLSEIRATKAEVREAARTAVLSAAQARIAQGVGRQ